MKILVQRVQRASVEINKEVVGAILEGVLVFVGITLSDTKREAEYLANKLVNLRIFKDSAEKINRSLLDIQGSALIISQFTLYADCEGGRRPSFTKSAPPEIASPLYDAFVDEVRKLVISVATGVFGADMKVDLINDGPFTVLLEK